MKRISLLFAIVLAVWSMALFGTSISSSARVQKTGERESATRSAKPAPGESGESDRPSGDEPGSKREATRKGEIEESEDDPDLPPDVVGLDKEAYLKRREQYVGLRRGIEFGRPFDPQARGRAIERMQVQEALQIETAKLSQLKSADGFFGLAAAAVPVWTPIGPAPLPNGPFTGRVTSIVVDPTNSNKVYLGTAQGGVWRSMDGGVNWVNIFDSAQSLAIGSLALAPSSPTTLYVGTGESNRSGDSFFGVGVYRVDNADTTATLVGPINPSFSFSTGGGTVTTTAFAGRSISKIIVHPMLPGTIFVSTSSGIGGNGANSLSNTLPPIALLGVYRSTNADGPPASITFQKLAVATAGGSLDVPGTGNRRVTDMVIEPDAPNNLIVGVFGNTGANDGGIFRSTNALDPSPTFTNVLNISSIRIQFAINKDINSGVVKVLAATSEVPTTASCSAAATQEGVLRQSVDGGVTWPASDATATTGGILTDAGGFCGGQCFYNVTVAIDPKNSNSIYLGGNVPGTCSGLMQRSSNGVNFVNDHNGLHADSHALYFDALTSPSTVFTGNDGGVWKRSADSSIGTFWTNLNSAPLNTLQFQSLAVHPTDRNVTIGGTQDNGTELQRTTSGEWSNSRGGDGGYTLIDQGATDTTNVTMYHTFFFEGGPSGTQIRFERVTTLAAAGAGQWTNIGCTASNPANGINCTDDVLFYAPMALGPGNPNTVYLGTDRLYRSTDRGTTNTIVSQAPIFQTTPGPPVVNSPISTIAISPQDDGYRVVGLQNGQVWATSTGSSTLTNITSGSFPANPNGSLTNRFVGRALVDPNNKDVAYIAFSFFAPAGKGVWKTTNLGAAAAGSASANWVSAGNGIPSVPINALAIDPTNSSNIFAGTDIGVYNSTDGGASWNPFGTGLPRSAVFDMAIQPTNRILRVATHGRGIWETSIPSTAAGYTVSGRVADGSNNPVSGVLITFEKNVQGTISTTTTTTDLNGDYSSVDFGCPNSVKVTPSKAGYVFSPSFITFVSSSCLGGSATANFTTPSNPSNTVQFSAASQGVAETVDQTTKIDLTVTRSGDISGAATIDYASANGTASDRSDYLASFGTLRFASNEASKTITVFIVDDRFAEGPETFTVNLSNPVGCILGSQGTFTVTIDSSNDPVDGPNPVNNASFNTDFFVRQHYIDFLNREADSSGLAFWKNEIDSCATQQCREIRRINVSAAFFVSIEFQQTGYLVYKANQAAFNPGEFLRLQDFLPDLQEIGRGVVFGQPGADAQLESNKQKFFLNFVQKPVFFAPPFYPTTLTAAQIVDKMNANTFDPRNPGAGALTPAERNNLVAQLSANPSSPTLRAQVLRTISENAVFNARQFNKAFVLMQYFGYLRRNPNDPPEPNLDYSGYNFWLSKLNQFNGNFVDAEMVKAFILSTEYQQRFGP
jgi:hypothetical protein